MSKKNRKYKRLERISSNMVVLLFATLVVYTPMIPSVQASESDSRTTIITKVNDNGKTNRALRKVHLAELKQIKEEYKQLRYKISQEFDRKILEARTKGAKTDLKKQENQLLGDAKAKYDAAIILAKKNFIQDSKK